MSYHQTIYNLLRGYGLSEAGALGMLGNWECESNCEPYRVQGDFQASRAFSKAYVEKIENRQMTGQEFAGDKRGFGLAQWTYPARKIDLYNFWLNSSHRIDSCELQCEFAIHELTRDYSGLLLYLKTADSIWDCVDKVCRQYERPAVNNVDARYQAALRIRQEINLDGDITEVPAPSEETTDKPKIESWPPRTIDSHCEGFPEIKLLQSLLVCHGYSVVVDGIFGKSLTEKVKQYQSEHGLDADGCVGPMSWKKLLAY